MKLIIAGASGYVATECIRQSLKDPRFTTVIALARKAIAAPTDLGPSADTSKFRSVVTQDYGVWPEDVTKQLAGADACIWTVAITPTKSKMYKWDDVKKICRDNAIAGFQAIVNARGDVHGEGPLRYIYMSGSSVERDQTKSPLLLKEYLLMRGETENAVLNEAAKHKGSVEACVAKPGLIYGAGNLLMGAIRWLPVPVTIITVSEVAAGMLDQLAKGFEKEPLESDDLARIGAAALQEQKAKA